MSFGYSSDIGEITPSMFAGLRTCKRTKLFLTLYNSCVEKELRVPLHLAGCGGIKYAFLQRISELLAKRGYAKSGRAVSFCLSSNLILQAFLKKDFACLAKILQALNARPAINAARLVQICHAGGSFNIQIDAKQIFTSFVFDKIALKHKDKEVFLKDDTIYIKDKQRLVLAVLPSFLSINADDESSCKLGANVQICKAFDILNQGGAEQVYIVCPRQSSFKRHIEICHAGAGRVKLVPYSIAHQIF